MKRMTIEAATHVEDKSKCVSVTIPKDCCYVSFNEDKKVDIASATALKLDTIRGETLVFDLSKDGMIVGFELIAPGQKPCQPLWGHNKPTSEE
jgi:hypothetical protein